MARTDALSIISSGSTKDKLAELSGKLIDSIQKNALSSKLKNTEYSGDPSTGSVEINRFANATLKNYGTARAAGNGDAIVNSGKVVINIDQDKEIVEEIAMKDVEMFGLPGIVERRVDNHASQMVVAIDKAFFTVAAAAATAVTTTGLTDIEDIAEAAIQAVETVENDYVEGVDRSEIVLTLNPAAYGKLRKYIDRVDPGTSGAEAVNIFHGVRVYSNVRQSDAIIAMREGSVGQPVRVSDYQPDLIPLSEDVAVTTFAHFGTKAVTPDLIFKVATV